MRTLGDNIKKKVWLSLKTFWRKASWSDKIKSTADTRLASPPF
jgi:hypothetical protein